jgi:hypothetical protein
MNVPCSKRVSCIFYGLSADHTRSAESIEDDDLNLPLWLVGLWTLISFPK